MGSVRDPTCGRARVGADQWGGARHAPATFDRPARPRSLLRSRRPGARRVKAFNTIGFENIPTAATCRQAAAMFAVGDDPDAKRVATELAAELGFVPEDAGGLANP